MSSVDDDDEKPLGRPIQAPLSAALPSPRASDSQVHVPGQSVADSATLLDDDPRPDEGPGRPPQVAVEMAPITESDYARIEQEQMREEEAEKRHIEEAVASDPMLMRLPAFLFHPLAISFAIGMAALLGLFIFSQITSTLAALASLNEGLRYTGYVGLTLLTGCVTFAVGRFGVFYFRLRPNRPLHLRAFDQLSQRTRLRWLVHEKRIEARDQLADYLRTYPLVSAKERKLLHSLGLSEEKLLQLEKVREELLDMNRFANIDDWVSTFRSRFQVVLDEAAEARVKYFGWRVAVSTALSPNTLVDTLLTAYCSFMMLADLCQVYNLRLGRIGTVVLLGRVFFNAYVAGQINEFEGVAEAWIEDLVNQTGIHLGGVAVSKIAGKTGARIAEGVLNRFLLKRLGRYASRLLRPVQAD